MQQGEGSASKLKQVPAKKTIPIISDPNFGKIDKQLLNICKSLQSSLIVTEVIEIFYKIIADQLQLAGISFTNNDIDCLVIFGTPIKTQYCKILSINNNNLGELKIFRQSSFDDQQINHINILTEYLLQPLLNAITYQKALSSSLTCPLTRLNNRAAFNNDIKRQIDYAKRHNENLALLVIDVDNFKKINDNFGHQQGDQVLIFITSKINQVLRQSDVAYRFGGEEFVILLQGSNIMGAEKLAARICKNIANSKYQVLDKTIDLSVSIGAAQYTQDDDFESLFEKADQALYSAKNSGKNTVVIFE